MPPPFFLFFSDSSYNPNAGLGIFESDAFSETSLFPSQSFDDMILCFLPFHSEM